LFLGELPNWRGDCRRRENGSRHLIEQWLEDVVISPVDQNDFGLAPSKRSRGCEPSEASADNHDPRRLVPTRLRLGGFIVNLSHASIPGGCEARIVPWGVLGNGKSRSVSGTKRSKHAGADSARSPGDEQRISVIIGRRAYLEP
jgi:hypothetical protein